MPKISVLINNRDNASYLRTCVESVLAQTRPADEVIAYDDGSVDESRAILASFAPGVRTIEGPGGTGAPMQNQAKAIEAAFARSTGDLIFLLDGDDAFGPKHIEAYEQAFARSESVIMVQAPQWKLNAHGNVVGVEYDPRRHAVDYVKHIHTTQDVNIYYSTSALAFRRSYLAQRLPLEEEPGLALWPDARLALVAPHFGEIVTLEEPHTYWRRHPGSHTVLKRTSVYEQMRMNREYYNRFCARTGRPLVHTWRSPQHMKRLLRHLCPPQLIDSYQHLTGRRGVRPQLGGKERG